MARYAKRYSSRRVPRRGRRGFSRRRGRRRSNNGRMRLRPGKVGFRL